MEVAIRGGSWRGRGPMYAWLAVSLVFVCLLHGGQLVTYRAFALNHSRAAAEQTFGALRPAPRLGWAAKQKARIATRAVPTDPPNDESADDASYFAGLEGVGVETRADLAAFVQHTRSLAIATLRDLHGPRADIEASVDYMIEVALSEAAAAARSVLT